MPRKIKSKVIVVVGEDLGDAECMKTLAEAIRTDLPPIRTFRKPIVLSRAVKGNAKDKFAKQLASLVKALAVVSDVRAVIAHRDCDDVEPAHVANTRELLAMLAKAKVPQPVAATPAFEIEAWWRLWPAALKETRRCWSPMAPSQKAVGTTPHAKEALRRDLRPSQTSSCPDYCESDGVKIAGHVKRLGLALTVAGRSQSYDQFTAAIMGIVA